MPPPPSGGKGLPGAPSAGATRRPPTSNPPTSSPPPPLFPSSTPVSGSIATSSVQSKPPTSVNSVPLTTSSRPGGGESLANIDSDKKIAVLKKAILALTKQKQDLEATKASLESKVTSLLSQLAASDERSAKHENHARELQQQLDALAKGGSGGRFAERAGSILKVFSGGDTAAAPSPAASPTSNEDQQRLFEENEALHIQLFEQRQQFERKYKQLEAEKSEMAMQLHGLEGVVASFQASDVAQSQQAEEALRELETERAYSKRCLGIILSGGLAPNHSCDGDDGAVKRIVTIYVDGVCDLLAGVSALMPHIPTNSGAFGVQRQTLESERKKGMFVRQQKERLQALSVSHRAHRQRILVEVEKIRNCLSGEDEVEGEGLDSLPALLRLLSIAMRGWVVLLHTNAHLIMGPLDAQQRTTSSTASQHQQTTTKVSLTYSLQQTLAAFVGEMDVVVDCIDQGASSTHTTAEMVSKSMTAGILVGLLGYREYTLAMPNAFLRGPGSSSAGVLFDRLCFDLTRALDALGGNSECDVVLSRHYLVCMEQLVAAVVRCKRQVASAVGLGPHVSSIEARSMIAHSQDATGQVDPKQYQDSTGGRGPVSLIQSLMALGGGLGEGAENDMVTTVGSAVDVWELVKASDKNAQHHAANLQQATMELARLHDMVDSLTQASGALQKDKALMKEEYQSVVQVYESQIALLSERLAELSTAM